MFTKIGLRDLAELCRRLSTSLEAGIDLRQTLRREADGRAPAYLRHRLRLLADMTAAGHTLAEALDRSGSFFPELFREMVALGEETGKLAEVLAQLAENYEHRLRVRRTFLSSIAWPMLQLTAAILVVGFVIWLMGLIASTNGGESFDILGFGLVGTRGLQTYFLIIGLLVAAGFAVYHVARRGLAGLAGVQAVVFKVPALGHSLMTLVLAQLAWTMHLTLSSGMDLQRALQLALASTRSPYFTQHTQQIVTDVMSGREIYESFARTGAFPAEFLERIEVGERSGRLPESMEVLSRQYQDEANRALAVLAMVAGFAVWALVALLIITLILRIAMFISGVYNEALSW